MNARLALAPTALPPYVKNLIGAHLALADSTVPRTTLELVNIRASQINGCGACLDMHTKEAEQLGETALRLHLVAVWREADVFTDAERAALRLAEEGTRFADGGDVTDATWAELERHYDAEQLSTLVGQVALINAFNRMNTILRQPAGHYVAGAH